MRIRTAHPTAVTIAQNYGGLSGAGIALRGNNSHGNQVDRMSALSANSGHWACLTRSPHQQWPQLTATFTSGSEPSAQLNVRNTAARPETNILVCGRNNSAMRAITGDAIKNILRQVPNLPNAGIIAVQGCRRRRLMTGGSGPWPCSQSSLGARLYTRKQCQRAGARLSIGQLHLSLASSLFQLLGALCTTLNKANLSSQLSLCYLPVLFG